MHDWLTWSIVALAMLGVIARPGRWPEWIWSVAGAAVLVLTRQIGLAEAWSGVVRGLDVYLFLLGMMLLAGCAKEQGLFTWLAGQAAKHACGSSHRLFWSIYLVGTLVTIFLSNDATAVVLTPAVAAVVRAMKVERPLPYLFICAFVANAASFVLPISNPANLVIYGARMPALFEWVARFAVPSALSIAATFVVLRLTQGRALKQRIEPVTPSLLTPGGRTAAIGIAITAVTLLVASAAHVALGLPTCLAAIATTGVVLASTRRSPLAIVRGVSWGVLALVAGLFVMAAALEETGVVAALASVLDGAQRAGAGAEWLAGGAVAAACNLTNNLPAGLVLGGALDSAHVRPELTDAVLVGIDLGPNFSVTGSLATVLWLQALRREGHTVSAWTFLKLGIVVTLPALALAIAGLGLVG